jgi:hypothetical protein
MTITHKVFGDAKPDATAKVYNAAISTNASKGKPKTEINLGGGVAELFAFDGKRSELYLESFLRVDRPLSSTFLAPSSQGKVDCILSALAQESSFPPFSRFSTAMRGMSLPIIRIPQGE